MVKPEDRVPAEVRDAAVRGCGADALRVYTRDQIWGLIPEIVTYTLDRTNATPNRPDVVQAEVLATYGVVICLQATVAFMADPGDGTPARVAGAGLTHMVTSHMADLHKAVLHDQIFGRQQDDPLAALRQVLVALGGDEA